jgi:glutathione synthase/RimK-type ligase-like ATP-grasp enzyme
MYMKKVALATQKEYIHPENPDAYIQNILLEDEILIDALASRNIRAFRVAWDDPQFDWGQVDKVIIRATWDYYIRYKEYRQWLKHVASKSHLVNPLDQVIWNFDKTYLLALHAKGIHIPDTMYIEAGEKRSLSMIANGLSWEEFVLKPAISGGGFHTYRFTRVDGKLENIFRDLIEERNMIIQAFQPYVVEEGEHTLVMINGEYSHAVLKKARPGEFRVQDDFGGTVHAYQPNAEEIQFAEMVMAAIHPVPSYARVDIIRDRQGKWALQEVEMIEPELWFRMAPEAAQKLANGLAGLIESQ